MERWRRETGSALDPPLTVEEALRQLLGMQGGR
jgi:hypothetical protein